MGPADDGASDGDGPPAADPNFNLEKELEPIVGLQEVKDMLHGFTVDSHGLSETAELPYDTALLSLLLSFCSKCLDI